MADEHAHWMQLAITEAAKAAAIGDIPVGAVVVRGGEIIGRGYNRREIDSDPTAHAEMMAIREAARVIGGWRLEDATLYCTLEPCAMCAGAMVLARLPRLVWATHDLKAGAGGSVMDILNHAQLNHRVEVVSGILAEEAAVQLRDFFQELRSRNRPSDGTIDPN